jgi:L-malate glycosyltransferase
MTHQARRASPLRVFQLIKGLGRGGAEVLLLDGPRLSDRARFTYGFGYFLPHKDALVAELGAEFPMVRCFPARTPAGMLAQVGALARHLREWRADVLHCHLPLAGVVGRLAGALAGVPVVYTEHNAIERYHPATRLAAKSTWRLQRRVVAVSADVAASVTRNIGQHVPIQVVLNGVSVSRFERQLGDSALARASLGLPADAPIIGSVAVFRAQKRLDLWLEVAGRVKQSFPHAHFLLVGDGPLRSAVEAQATQLGLRDCLTLPGLQADVRPYLRAMDLYLMTSDFEGIPIALLEAMAMRLPSVLTDAGGIPEVVRTGQDGEVRSKGDLLALAEAVTKLLASPETRLALGNSARSRVEQNFSTARMMRELEEVYANAARH